MKVTISSDDTVTIVVDLNELGMLDYGLGYFQATASERTSYNTENDLFTANEMEKQLWDAWCMIDHGRHAEA